MFADMKHDHRIILTAEVLAVMAYRGRNPMVLFGGGIPQCRRPASGAVEVMSST